MKLLFGLWAVCAVLTLDSPGIAFAASSPGEDGSIVISAEEIAEMKAVRMADVLGRVPGVKVGDSFIAIHGNYKVKVLVDGRPINDPTSSHGGVKWDMVSLENVQRIEILKGKGALQYGDDASGGVVLIETKKIHQFSGNTKIYGGNHRTWNLSTNNRILKGDFGGAMSAAYDTTDGYNVNNDKEKWRAGAKMEYTGNAVDSYTLSVDYLEESGGYSGLPDYPTPQSRYESRMASYSLLATVKKVNAKTYFNDGEKHNTDESRSLDTTLRVKKAGQDIATSISIGENTDLSVGGAFNWGKADGSTMADREETSASVFTVASRSFSTLPISFDAGVRCNFYSEFDNSINPEVKITRQGEKVTGSFSFSRSSNAPSFHQRYNESSSTRPNPDLGMEAADNYSLSVSAQVSQSVSATTTVFYNKLTDRITYVLGEDGIGRYENIGEASYRGGDLSVIWKPAGKFSLTATYTYLEARDDETGLWLTSKSRHKANAEFLYAPVEKLSLVGGIDYASKAYTNTGNSASVPAYTIGRVRGEYGFSHLSIFAEVQNLTDETYFYADGNLAPPRTWLFGLNWTY